MEDNEKKQMCFAKIQKKAKDSCLPAILSIWRVFLLFRFEEKQERKSTVGHVFVRNNIKRKNYSSFGVVEITTKACKNYVT